MCLQCFSVGDYRPPIPCNHRVYTSGIIRHWLRHTDGSIICHSKFHAPPTHHIISSHCIRTRLLVSHLFHVCILIANMYGVLKRMHKLLVTIIEKSHNYKCLIIYYDVTCNIHQFYVLNSIFQPFKKKSWAFNGSLSIDRYSYDCFCN